MAATNADKIDYILLWPRWLRFEDACSYVGLKPGTLNTKIDNGTGPKFHRSPGSRDRVFWTGDLDDWIRNSPERALTPAEIERGERFQAASLRAREKQRARRRAQATAMTEKRRAERRAKTREDATT
jgi:hypothetical protein